jgi:hypothetical protein
MTDKHIRSLLKKVESGHISVENALEALKHLPYEDMDFAKIDHHRGLRNSVPEVIYAKDKRPEDIIAIARSMSGKSGRFLITKGSEDIYIKLDMPGALFHPRSGMISYGGELKKKGLVLVVSAGTSDIPIAEEAEVTASFLGSKTERLHDVGVAGIHRLLRNRGILEKARVVIVTAGMEGALPSVVGGITNKPVIAVPTSVGYGTSLGGLTALFAMLNSCVPGIAVMNIDNGFGAGCLAHKINLMK